MNPDTVVPLRAAVAPTWRATPRSRYLAVACGIALLAASSHVSVPLTPVPLTLQTLAVTLVGALLGPRLGMLTVLAWLLAAAIGLPVLAPGGAPGLARFAGPTAGYLFAFPVAAFVVGWLVEHGWNGQRVVRAFAAMAIGNVLCLAVGAGWLAVGIGIEKAWLAGVLPFLTGAALKSVLGAALLRAMPSRLTG